MIVPRWFKDESFALFYVRVGFLDMERFTDCVVKEDYERLLCMALPSTASTCTLVGTCDAETLE